MPSLKRWNGSSWNLTRICVCSNGVRWGVKPVSVNLSGSWVPVSISADTTSPVISVSSPLSGTSMTTYPMLSYNLSKTMNIIYVKWTRTSGLIDLDSPHIGQMYSEHGYDVSVGGGSGVALLSGTHLNNDYNEDTYPYFNEWLAGGDGRPILISGTTYTMAISGTDPSGNISNTKTVTGIKYVPNNVVPEFNLTKFKQYNTTGSKVTYGVSTALSSGQISYIISQGYEDLYSPHICSLTGLELSGGYHNNITLSNPPSNMIERVPYIVHISGVGENGYNSYDATASFEMSTEQPTVYLEMPLFVNSLYYQYMYYGFTSWALESGTITWTQTGGTTDAGSPKIFVLDLEELNGTGGLPFKHPKTLVNGSIYTVQFDAVDYYGNVAIPAVVENVMYDTTKPIFTITHPISSTTESVSNPYVGYSLSEDLSQGTITWTRSGGTADPNSPYACEMYGDELLMAVDNSAVLISTAPTLNSGTRYSVKFQGTDLAGNISTAKTITNVTYT